MKHEEGKRFAGELGNSYDLFPFAYPEHEEFQDSVGEAISSWAQKNTAPEIICLEIGCGTGATTRRIVNASTRIRLTSVDNEPQMLAQARKAFRSTQTVEFVQADLCDYLADRPDQSVDIFVSAYTIHNLAPIKRKDVFHHIGRVVRPGGLFVNGDIVSVDDPGLHAQHLVAQLLRLNIFDELGHPTLRDEWSRHYLEDEAIRYTERFQAQLLEQNGFIHTTRVFRAGLEATFTAIKATKKRKS